MPKGSICLSGIEGDAAQPARGVVAEQLGDEAVRGLVEGDGDDDRHRDDGDIGDLAGYACRHSRVLSFAGAICYGVLGVPSGSNAIATPFMQ